MLCGTEPFPELFRAKKYKIHQKFLSKVFLYIIIDIPFLLLKGQFINDIITLGQEVGQKMAIDNMTTGRGGGNKKTTTLSFSYLWRRIQS